MAQVRVTRRGAPASAEPDADDAPDVADYDAPASADAGADDAGMPADAPAPAEAAEAAPAATAGTPAEAALQSVERILQYVGADVDVALRSDFDDAAGGPVIDIAGPDSGLLIGRRGNTLQSLQFIVQSIVRQQFEEEVRVSLDVEQYRQRREDSLREMADRVANRVAQTGRGITLEPMTPYDRRVIHVYLGEREGIRTESVGYGEGRKVQIIPDRG